MFDLFITFINELPNRLYPGVYDAAEDHNIFEFIFWWRELFHFAGGLALGLICPFPIVFATFLFKEWYDDCSRNFANWDFKNTTDAAMWGLGALVSNLIIYLVWKDLQ